MKRLSVNGVHLNVLVRGSGAPLLLVHGFPLDHTMWQGQVEQLSGSHQVIAPDLRGFGQSDAVPGTVTMSQLADDLADLLAALDVQQPVTFCGLSMGGYVAWQFWQRHRARLARLIVCDTRAAADSPEVARFRLDTAERVIHSGSSYLADSMTEKLFAPQTVKNRPQLIEQVRRTMLDTDPHVIAATLRGMAQRPDTTSWLDQIRVPTLVVCGQYDVISPPDEMREIASAIPNARFVQIDDAGHMAPLEQPAAVNAAIQQKP